MNSSTHLPPPEPDPQDRKTPWLDPEPSNRTPTPPQPASTQQTPPTADRAATDENPKKVDLSLSQVLGGALAAMTAAALGSRLGVAGTITGAAVASVIAAVAGSLYTASLRRTREKVKTVWSGRIVGSPERPSTATESTSDPSTRVELPVHIDVVPEAAAWELPDAAPRTKRRRNPTPWRAMLVGAVTAFAIAAVALTGFELLSGQALSGGQGTTIEQVRDPQKSASTPTTKASSSESSASPSDSESPSDSASPSESASETPEASPSDQPTAPETAAPTTEQPTPEPSDPPAEPSASSRASASSKASTAPTDAAPSGGGATTEETPAG